MFEQDKISQLIERGHEKQNIHGGEHYNGLTLQE
jgi:hypothetical protein